MSNLKLFAIFDGIAGRRSRVIGIDHYKLSSFDGTCRHWTSYTLQSETSAADRWWLVIFPELGAFAFDAGRRDARGLQIDPAYSGLVVLKSEGDAALSDDTGALVVYRLADGELYCEEAFEGVAPLHLLGRPVSGAFA